MATVKFLLAFICFAVIGSNHLYRINRLSVKHRSDPYAVKRETLINLATAEVGVREATNHNDGVRVETYLAAVGLKKPEPYCAAFISYIFARAGYARPRSGWSPDFFPDSRITHAALPADVLGIYFPEYQRIAHVGLIVKQKGSWIYSIEGNTNVAGSREGSGVYRKVRHIRTVHRMADWVAERRVVP